MSDLLYDPGVFDAADQATARAVILTPEGGSSTDQRWEAETPLVAERAGALLGITAGHILIDYGCGIGRISKALIERFGCRIVGVDLSAKMRDFAVEYVDSDRFSAVSHDQLIGMLQEGFRADGAVVCWVLQHCAEPARDIELIDGALRPGAPVFVLNNSSTRAVPVQGGWVSDGKDVRALLRQRWTEAASERPDPAIGPPLIVDNSFIAVYRKAAAVARPGLWARLKQRLG